MSGAHSSRERTGAGASLPAVRRVQAMSKLIRGGLAGVAAWKWGGGIIGTILVFLIVFWLLGLLF